MARYNACYAEPTTIITKSGVRARKHSRFNIRDHRVKFRSETEIAGYAQQVRSYLGCCDSLPIDIIAIVRFLEGKPFPKKGPLFLKLFDKEGVEPDAKVTFEPLTMHIENELWEYARLGDPFSRFVLAHEVGHAVLHDKDAKAFSRQESGFDIFGFDETSAEWQANVFAGHLLAPDALARQSYDAAHLAREANIEFKRANSQLNSLNSRKLWRKTDFFGEACRKCASLTLMRFGLKLTCITCRDISEI